MRPSRQPADPERRRRRTPERAERDAADETQIVSVPSLLRGLQSSVGNRDVQRMLAAPPGRLLRDRGQPTSGSQAPATDAGAPAADAGAPAADAGAPGTEPPEMRAELDEIVARYRAMIAAARTRGANVAADNLQHFLDGRGGTRVLSVPWLRGFAEVTAAERTNQERFESSLNDQANRMNHGDRPTFRDHWDRMLTGSGELYYASGTSTITSNGTFDLEMIENEVSIFGTVEHRWHDPYDWHAGLSAYVPGFGSISDEDGLKVQRYRGARPFDMEARWTQSLSGHITVGTLWNTKRFEWSGP